MQVHQQKRQKKLKQWHFRSQEETCRITSNSGTDAGRNEQQQKQLSRQYMVCGLYGDVKWWNK
jgi:hypothetical protein